MGRAFEARRAGKEKRWGEMSRLFPKLGKVITMAAKAGGSDPESNTALKTAVNNAKAQNMPKDNIEKAIKRATAADAANYDEVSYEGKGPHGALLWVECATDNATRTVANVKSIFNKNGGQVVNNGSLDFMFDRKAVIEFAKSDDLDLEDIELNLIDHGLEEMDVQDDRVLIYGDFTSFGDLTKACEDMGIEGVKATLQRISNNPQEFTEAQIEEIEVLIDKLEEDDDVQSVFTNIA
ncbi:YebC/PmpR family DNA-binding transcriptional regulator [Verrucomicrobiaceae bacterium R5-34]|uniref:Probable transcriptional regulatory protein JIN83_00305 n=1 Tax=Oceaniferula flava TaxID=2800421 RepID=A0AAE2SAP8_9BACT|nr:YebC/PmpR family DNA-binding transcriptional regulator [Oceaniferula flavus]MBK1829152.1 YebC/PmpR family DNA-binding transcriptional regulator [Verrucomicrobiaceae bacterium R5-34]MBK1853389.1 YebC/PmpR family DNA-binding transcriptional regulator [Oceaniferula flavus]MBM1134694.1 YebC/PmpR family DNA-binding transcriptional regulator [Oceaniferula flavus]